jgi:aspartate/methionine/tyrosine aminotransferase
VIGALCAAGDEVVVPVPYYFDHDMWLRAEAVTPVYVATGADFVPDPDAIEAAITPRTRAVVLVTPNNPTGAEYPAAVIAAIAEIARRRGVVLILDETYREFRDGEGAPHAELARPDWRDHVVHLTSFSKSLAIPGSRVGALLAGPEIRREVAKLLDCQTICAPRPAQEAVAFGLTHLGDWMAERRAAMRARVEAGRRVFADEPGGFHLGASGAFFAYVRHPYPELDATTVARRLLAERGVLCIPGDAFGPGQSQWLRLAFGNVEADVIPEVGRRLAIGGSA